MSEEKGNREERRKARRNIKRPNLPVVIPLEFPVKHGEQELTELKIENRITVKEMRLVADCGSDGEAMAEMFILVFGIPESVVDRIDAIDMQFLTEAMQDFLPETGPMTGPKGLRS